MAPRKPDDPLEPVAGNGLLHRRVFLTGGAILSGLPLMTAARAEPQHVPESMRVPGAPLSAYGERAPAEDAVRRHVSLRPGAPGTGSSRTPLDQLEGEITPSALHFERHHNGVPAIEADRHRLLIHGLVERPLVFDLAALSRYPLVTRVQFLECSGNSGSLHSPRLVEGRVGELHGLVSCSEWTGVPLSILLDEAGVKAEGRWLLAEGADAVAMSRSIPVAKAMDDALIALYQNGERLRPAQGYPMRLFLPGWEGNANVKWLRRLKLTAGPTMTRDETSKYADLLPDGHSTQFTFRMGVKSLITSPSGGHTMAGPGLYQVSGLAWSGAGRIRRVEVSADGGRSWDEAALPDHRHDKGFTRFRMAWRWDGGPAMLQSRAVDETGAVQPTRGALLAERGPAHIYHYNAIQTWQVAPGGSVRNAYA